MAVTIAQISDSHLSAAKRLFDENFAHTATDLRERRPDLVINSGDLALDGADLDADLEHAKQLHDAIGLPWRAIPGNHDVGDSVEVALSQPVNATRIARFRRIIGDTWWHEDVPGWRILALDGLLLGSGSDEDAAQLDFIRARTQGLGGRALMVLIHKPLFLRTPDEGDKGGMFLTSAPRAALLAAFGPVVPSLVASGHVHQFRDLTVGPTRHLWAPGLSFVTPPWFLPDWGVRTIGYLEHVLSADGSFTSRLIGVSGTTIHDLENFPQAYGDMKPQRPKRG
jgi:3',5'-cyclic AMP phosphodiesterase CpdA